MFAVTPQDRQDQTVGSQQDGCGIDAETPRAGYGPVPHAARLGECALLYSMLNSAQASLCNSKVAKAAQFCGLFLCGGPHLCVQYRRTCSMQLSFQQRDVWVHFLVLSLLSKISSFH